MRVPEEPVCVHLFRQKPVFTSLHLKSPVHVHRLSVFSRFQPMRVSEEPVCINLFRQNPVFTSLHLRSPESIATLPPFGPIEGHIVIVFFQISSQWEFQKNRFAFTSFCKIQFLSPCIWDLPFVSYRLGGEAGLGTPECRVHPEPVFINVYRAQESIPRN